MAGRWDGSLPPIAGAARAAGYWPAWLLSAELAMYVLSRTAAAAAVGIVAALAFVATVSVAWWRARARAEPIRLAARSAADAQSPRLRDFLLAFGATLTIVLLREIQASYAHRGGAVSGDAYALGTTVAEAPILGIAAFVLAVSCVALFIAARRAHALPSGTLAGSEAGPCVQIEGTTYLLTAVPEGVAPGDRITFLALPAEVGGTGPYRRSVPVSLAPKVWHGPSWALAQQLARRARRHAAWAALTLVTLALLL